MANVEATLKAFVEEVAPDGAVEAEVPAILQLLESNNIKACACMLFSRSDIVLVMRFLADSQCFGGGRVQGLCHAEWDARFFEGAPAQSPEGVCSSIRQQRL